jgi:hypothetical protein
MSVGMAYLLGLLTPVVFLVAVKWRGRGDVDGCEVRLDVVYLAEPPAWA